MSIKGSSGIRRDTVRGETKSETRTTQSTATKKTNKASRTSIKDVSSLDMKRTYDELHKFREFVRICDMRENLGWPREVFDEMIRTLRDNRTIRIMRADHSILTETQWRDSFVDENNFVMGTMIWQNYNTKNITIPVRR